MGIPEFIAKCDKCRHPGHPIAAGVWSGGSLLGLSPHPVETTLTLVVSGRIELNWILWPSWCQRIGEIDVGNCNHVFGVRMEKTSQGVNGKWLSLLTRRESGIHMKENYNLTKMLWIVIRKNLKL